MLNIIASSKRLTLSELLNQAHYNQLTLDSIESPAI